MRVLAVDDNIDALFVLEEFLKAQGYEVVTASDGDTSLKIILSNFPDLVLLDINMPGLSGLEVLRAVRAHPEARYTPIILLTARGETEEIVKGLEAGADDYIVKPYDTKELLARLKAASKTKALYSELKTARANEKRLADSLGGGFSKIAGSGLSGTIETLKKVIDTPVPILLLGETGTGKELFARAIHYESNRSEKPFVTQNCATFSSTLLESELFGHVKGAFTDAVKDKDGVFTLADNGTLFLDEIGELPLPLQAKLLRVLQEGKFTPVGDTKERTVSVRVVAATHRDLPSMIKAGTFREDLYYRINLMPISIPPLRERRSDIPLLVEIFLSEAEVKFGKGKKKVNQKFLQSLCEYDWPGNVRQLQNEIYRLYLLSEADINDQFLSPEIHLDEFSAFSLSADADNRETSSLKDALASLEKNLIERELKACEGNKSEVARKLGISRSNLIQKVQAYGLEP